MNLWWDELWSLLNTQFQNSVHTEFVHMDPLASRCINAPLRYAEYAENEVKRNRTLRCSREDCPDGKERERERARGLHGCALVEREHYIVAQN